MYGVLFGLFFDVLILDDVFMVNYEYGLFVDVVFVDGDVVLLGDFELYIGEQWYFDVVFGGLGVVGVYVVVVDVEYNGFCFGKVVL